FIFGVGLAGLEINIWFSLLIAIIIGFLVFSSGPKNVLIFTLICFLGYFYFHLYGAINKDIIPFEEQASFSGLIRAEPEERIESTRLEIKLALPNRGYVSVYVEPTNKFDYGDVITFQGIAKKSTSGNLNIVSFPKNVQILEREQGSSIKQVLFNIKNRLISNLKIVLPAEKSALISGILFGERAEFSNDLKEAMKGSGTTHIVALSGYNIAILTVTLAGALAYLWNRRRAFWISLLVIPAFVIMTGGEPSVIRAGIMGIIALLAMNQERIYSFRNAIALTGLGMLLYDPTLLTSDVGFQLSFVALLGIVYIYPWLGDKFKIKTEGFLNWRTNALQTLSAQIAVLPIVLITFGFFSPTAPLANILILEFIPITMFMGFLSAVLGLFFYPLSLLVGWATNLLLSYEIFIIELFAFNWL
ncbi:ComEC/Rec2 family competence protein, partial [Patescibacteria group bacterium]|nr:ComEC/Rec2 family competence protein [Patescibacteria group bacterium]